MRLLIDKEIVARLAAANPFIEGVKTPPGGDWYCDASPVEAASLDLTIGNIFVPSESNRRNDPVTPRSTLTLEPGGTAIIVSEEELTFPGNIAGLAMPKSRFAFKGVIVTNPGHVDPGYCGRLRFTIINMGRDHFFLKKGEPIIKLLVLELSKHPEKNWFEREGRRLPDPSAEDINLLNRDFLDVRNRAIGIAQAELTRQGLLLTVSCSIFMVVFVVYLAFLLEHISTSRESEWNQRLLSLEETKAQLDTLPADLTKLSGRLDKLEQQSAASASVPPPPKSPEGHSKAK